MSRNQEYGYLNGNVDILGEPISDENILEDGSQLSYEVVFGDRSETYHNEEEARRRLHSVGGSLLRVVRTHMGSYIPKD